MSNMNHEGHFHPTYFDTIIELAQAANIYPTGLVPSQIKLKFDCLGTDLLKDGLRTNLLIGQAQAWWFFPPGGAYAVLN